MASRKSSVPLSRPTVRGILQPRMTITSRSGIVWLLTGLNLLNYLDRYIIAAVGPKMQDELNLDETQLGFVLTAFMLGYFVTSPVFGALGDRRPRRGLIAVGVALWSIATAVSGLARGFSSMIAARVAVGVGEASYATLAPTIIDDLSDPATKNKWLAIFYMAIPVGSALGFVIGGIVESQWNWRVAFFVAGLPGIALAGLVLLMKEPVRKTHERRNVLEGARDLSSIPLYRGAVLGYIAYTFALGAFAVWAPSYLNRVLDMDLAKANGALGPVLAVAGFVGTWIGGKFGDRAAAAGADAAARTRGYLRVCAVVTGLAAVPALLSLLAPTPVFFFIGFGVCCVLLFSATAPINAALLQSVPEASRASAMAISIFAIHLFGDLPSPPIVGQISDRLRGAHSLESPQADAALRTAMLITLPAFIALGALAWGWFSRSSATTPAAAAGASRPDSQGQGA